MTHTITILGSTGSIGRQTLSVAEELGLRVAALTAEKNVDLLEAQCRKYRPELAVMTENAAAEELKTRLRRHDGECGRGGIKDPSCGYEYKGARGQRGAV